MQQSTRELVKVLAICFAVMMALPLGYRLWLLFFPPPPPPPPPPAPPARVIELLKTPPANWSDANKRAEPKIYAWLETQHSTILPWDWSKQMRQKDQSGYRKLWQRLFKDRGKELSASLKAEQKHLKQLNRDIEIAETLYSHRTNQLSKVESFIATNVSAKTVMIERLSKGRLWGWNRDVEEVSIPDYLNTERQSLKDAMPQIAELKTKRESSAERESALQVVVSYVESTIDEIAKKFPDEESVLMEKFVISFRNLEKVAREK